MDDQITKTRLVVLFGGRSAEHDISCISALHVLRAIDPARYEVVAVGIDREGRWFGNEVALESARAETGVDALVAEGEPVSPSEVMGNAWDRSRTVVFPVLHGPYGEDGAIQGLLESLDVAYVGTGVAGSAVSMDKSIAKSLVSEAGLPQCRWLRYTAADDLSAVARRATDAFGFPVFVKPANLGSSIGISKASTPEELTDAIETALSYDDVLVIEEAVTAREIEVAVLGNAVGDIAPRASVPGEIIVGNDFYDYTGKYLTKSAELSIPAALPEAAIAEVQHLALETYRTLRGDGLARVDFFYEESGRGWLLNEMNTMPGFTPVSMYPQMWQASGVSYSKLIDELVRLAVQRQARRRGFSVST